MSEVDELVSLTVSGRERRLLEGAAWCVAHWPWQAGEARGLVAGHRGRARRLLLELDRSAARLDSWTGLGVPEGLVPDEVVAARRKVRSVLVLPRRDWQLLARGLAATVIDLADHEREWRAISLHGEGWPTMRDVRALGARLAALGPLGDVRCPRRRRFAPVFGGPTVSLSLPGPLADLLDWLAVELAVGPMDCGGAPRVMRCDAARGRAALAELRLSRAVDAAWRALGLHTPIRRSGVIPGWKQFHALRAPLRIPLVLALADLELLAWGMREPIRMHFGGESGFRELSVVAWAVTTYDLTPADVERLARALESALAAARARWPHYRPWPR